MTSLGIAEALMGTAPRGAKEKAIIGLVILNCRGQCSYGESQGLHKKSLRKMHYYQ